MKTYADPGDIVEVNKGQSWLQVAWEAPEDDVILSHAFQYSEVRWEPQAFSWTASFTPAFEAKSHNLCFPQVEQGKTIAWLPHTIGEDPVKTQSGSLYNATFSGLSANTDYSFRLKVKYKSNDTSYLWPDGPQFTFKTDGKAFPRFSSKFFFWGGGGRHSHREM